MFERNVEKRHNSIFFFEKNLSKTLSQRKKKSSPLNIISKNRNKLFSRNKPSSLTSSGSFEFSKKRKKKREKQERKRIAREARWGKRDLGSIGTAEWMARGAVVSGIGWLTDWVPASVVWLPLSSDLPECVHSFIPLRPRRRFKDRSNSRYLIATRQGRGELLFTTR